MNSPRRRLSQVVRDGLAVNFAGPHRLLYLLHTARTSAPLGRYEGPEMDGQAVEAFLERFGPFLDDDARMICGFIRTTGMPRSFSIATTSFTHTVRSMVLNAR
jgi:hypothetical protein